MTSSPEEIPRFGAFDFCVFIGLMVVQGLLGIYHALRGDRHKTVRDFLNENRSINPVPIALSVMATAISSMTYLGVPAEAYIYGPTYLFMAFNKPIVALIVARTFLPVFYRLKVNTIYEYLERRFGKAVSVCGAGLNFLFILVCTGIIIYGPALALTTVTGFPLTYAIVLVGITCSFYTMLGGAKAIMWTNLFQTSIMLTAFLSTLVVGMVTVGGRDSIRRVLSENQVKMNVFNPNPAIRTSFWSCFIGGTFLCLSAVASNQQMLHRFLKCKTLRQAQNAAWLGFIGMGIIDVSAVCTGMIMYVYYHGCDPYSSGKVRSADQMMPYFTVDLFSEVFGLSGLLVFSVFSASLSAVSTQLNSLANMTGYGVIKRIYPKIANPVFRLIIKILVVLFGICTVGIAFLASSSQGVLQASWLTIGIIVGPLLGILSLGILCPQSNTKGALSGMVASLVIGLWLFTGSVVYPPHYAKLPQSTDMCYNTTRNGTIGGIPHVNTTVGGVVENGTMDFSNGLYTTEKAFLTLESTVAFKSDYSKSSIRQITAVQVTTVTEPSADDGDYPPFASLYSLSFLHYGFLAWGITFSVGILVSYFFKSDKDNELEDYNLVATVCDTYSCCLPDSVTRNMKTSYHSSNKNCNRFRSQEKNIRFNTVKLLVEEETEV